MEAAMTGNGNGHKPMDDEKWGSYRDHLLEEPESFRKATQTAARAVVSRLLGEYGHEERVTIHALLTIVANSNHFYREELFLTLVDYFLVGPHWGEFIRAMLEVVQKQSGEKGTQVFPLDVVRSCFDDTRSFEALWASRDLIGNKKHPLFGVIACDRHWESQLRLHVAKGDFARAWDDLKRSLGGWLSQQARALHDSDPVEEMQRLRKAVDRGDRYLMATMPVGKALVTELFLAMHYRGLIPRLPATEALTAFSYQDMQTPGMTYALMFLPYTRAREANPPEYYMILRMADYFSRQREERRRNRKSRSTQPTV
jgi:hypothetical protein